MPPEHGPVPQGFQLARWLYLVIEVLQVPSFIWIDRPTYVCAGEQLWLPSDVIPEKLEAYPVPIRDTFILPTLRAITMANDQPVPALFEVGRDGPAWDPDLLTCRGAGAPAYPRRGFRCECGQLVSYCWRCPWGGYLCEPCYKAGGRRGRTTPSDPPVFEDGAQHFVVEMQPMGSAPALAAAEVQRDSWRACN